MKNDELEHDWIHQKLEQHEHTITQLLAIIAINNNKLTDLSRRQILLEQITNDYLPTTHSFTPNRLPPVSSHTSQKNE